MKRLIALSALATTVFLGGAPIAVADSYIDGNQLYEQCAADPGEFSAGACTGYIVGIADVLEEDNVGPFTACIPNQAIIKQLRDVVQKYLSLHPEQRQFTASSIVASALSEAFPC